ncbi:MAG: hypothetical protein ACE5JG_01625 [Planctomycetota bacterium]
MAVRERVIGSGYLVVGLAVVVILLIVFTGGGMGGEEARDRLLDLYARYLKAGEQEDYLQQKRVAAEAAGVIGDAGRAAVKRALEGARQREREARGLLRLMRERTFVRNADGEFQFDGAWFPIEPYHALRGAEAALEGPVRRALHPQNRDSVRGVARLATEALDEARAGSGRAIPLPAAAGGGAGDDRVLRADRELYRVFAVDDRALVAALGAPQGNKSARLRWNRDFAGGDLADLLGAVPGHVRAVRKAADALERHGAALGGSADAQAAARKLLKRAAAVVARGMPAEEQARYETISGLVALLRAESALLEPHLEGLPDLAAAFRRKFP